VTREEAAIALTDRALVGDDVIDPAIMNALTEQAIALLEDGQRNAAAALFDGARMLKPADTLTQNNYAFCIVVDQPEQARYLLRDALTRGVRYPAITLSNLALAESLLGNSQEALRVCDQAYEAADDSTTAYLWRRTKNDWDVVCATIPSWIADFRLALERSGNMVVPARAGTSRVGGWSPKCLPQILHQQEEVKRVSRRRLEPTVSHVELFGAVVLGVNQQGADADLISRVRDANQRVSQKSAA
jgi:tetratricopeptide (TPR) repeat protein